MQMTSYSRVLRVDTCEGYFCRNETERMHQSISIIEIGPVLL
jgi:hypothetical protein